MLIDNSLKTNPAEISEGFNAYFSSIAEKLLPKHTAGTKHFSEYLSDRVDQNFIFECADPVEVINIIDSLDINKGTGPYSIPGSMLKFLVKIYKFSILILSIFFKFDLWLNFSM